MTTPSIQTLITQAQQVLNLKSTNEIRATLAAVLANANVGTPLNPSLTTQQLWDEFYEIVRQPSDDIMSIVVDQMMRMVFSPPAPGGAGADKQVIFNDGGVLAGDAGLVYNKTTDALTVTGLVTAGSATITGALTVDTTTLVVDSTNDRVGIKTASPADILEVVGNGATGIRVSRAGLPTQYATLSAGATGPTLDASAALGSLSFGLAGTTAMTLNSTGLGVGVAPNQKFVCAGPRAYFAGGGAVYGIGVGFNTTRTAADQVFFIGATDSATPDLVISNGAGSQVVRIDNTGNVGVGVTPSAWGSNYTAVELTKGACIWGAKNVPYTNVGANVYNDATNEKYVVSASTAATKYLQASGIHSWYNAIAGTAGNVITFTQAMTLDASGNLLVGTTTNSDVFKTNIQFSGTGTNGLIVKNLASTGGPALLYLLDSAQTLNNTGSSAYYEDSTALRWKFFKNGGLSNFQANNTNLSDIRVKTDIKPLTSYWNKIKALELVTFKYKDQTHSDDNIGLIAQQVESVAPELIDVDGFGETPADGVPLKTIYSTDLYHAAIKALQEAMTRIEVLESKLA